MSPVALRSRFPKHYSDVVARLRVPCGFLLVAAFAWFSKPSMNTLSIGLPISVAGLMLRAWAAGHLAKDRELAQSGPYAYTRNPLYMGTLLVAAGLVVASRSLWLGVLFAAVFLLIYLPVVELEQQHLSTIFPAYAAYSERVPAFWPKWPGGPGERRFDATLYWKNREYQALLGFLAGALWLIWKAS